MALCMFAEMHLNRRHKSILFLTLLATGISLISDSGIRTAAGIVLLGFAFAWAFGSNSRLVHALFIACGLLLVVGPLLFVWNDHRNQARLYEERVTEFERKIPEFAKKYPQVQYVRLPDGSYGKFRADATDEQIRAIIEMDFPNGFQKSKRTMIPQRAMSDGERQEIARWTKSHYPELSEYTDDSVVEALLARRPERVRAEYTAINPKTGGRVGRNGSKRVSIKPSESSPKWIADAIAAGVDLANVPDAEKPGDPPEPFSLKRELTDSSISTLFVLPGLFLMVTGVGLVFGVRAQ